MQAYKQNIINICTSGNFFMERRQAQMALSKALDVAHLASNSQDPLAVYDRYKQLSLRVQSLEMLSRPSEGSGGVEKTNTIAKLSFSGVMLENDDFCTYGMQTFSELLASCYHNAAVEGIFISFNTGGGDAVAAEILHSSIAERNKPVVVRSNYLYSAGYYGTCPADAIIAATPLSGFGSIGVKMVLNKWLVKEMESQTMLYSKKSSQKDAAINLYTKNNDPSLLIDELTELDEVMMQGVQQHRQLKGNEATIKHSLSGDTFLAEQALRRGLIDGIAGEQAAIRQLLTYL